MYLHPIASTTVNGSTENGAQRSLRDSLTEKLKTMENEDSPSDEESDEQNNLIFTETASSAGSELPLQSSLYHHIAYMTICGTRSALVLS